MKWYPVQHCIPSPFSFERLPNQHSFKAAVYRNLAGAAQFARKTANTVCPIELLLGPEECYRAVPVPHAAAIALCKVAAPASAEFQLFTVSAKEDNPKTNPNFTT